MKNKPRRGKGGRRQAKSAAGAARPAGQGPPGDFLIGGSRLAEKVREIVSQTPEVRAEKVAALKEALAKGAYRVDARKIANILILQMLTERERP
jgi:negative regulator of flagellin synthesis FlgM